MGLISESSSHARERSPSAAKAIAVQIAAFISAFHAIQYTATGISGNYNLGTNEPLLVLGS